MSDEQLNEVSATYSDVTDQCQRCIAEAIPWERYDLYEETRMPQRNGGEEKRESCRYWVVDNRERAVLYVSGFSDPWYAAYKASVKRAEARGWLRGYIDGREG